MKVLNALALFVVGCATAMDARASTGLADERFDCLIEPLLVIELGSPAQGVVKSVSVDRSDSVTEGQVLAELESSVEEAALHRAHAHAKMNGELQAAEADLKLAQQNLSRIDELYRKRMASSQHRDEALAEFEVAKMHVRQAAERRELASYEASYARRVVEKRKIRSPIAGVVVERKAFPGEFVFENPIMTIAQLNPLRVEVILPSSHYGELQAGMRAEIHAEVSDESVHIATVKLVDRVIDAGSSTFGAQLELANPGLTIPAGQRCELVFVMDESESDQLAFTD